MRGEHFFRRHSTEVLGAKANAEEYFQPWKEDWAILWSKAASSMAQMDMHLASP